jgi:membrane-associated protease RseP (regulator of RpoE activity)
VTWETDRTDTHHRAAWLVLDEMRTPTEPPLPDVNEFSRDLSLHFGVVGYGTRVSLIQPGSTAQRLGLRPGDTIESINGRPMPDATELEAALRAFHPGERVVLIVTRGDERMELHGTTAREDGPGPVMFIPSRSSGRVDLVKAGNTVQAHTRGIAAFTLLLSPDAFDFSQPVRVTVNGRVAFDGRVERSLETLMKWAARDNDRTMLFGAELKLEVGM